MTFVLTLKTAAKRSDEASEWIWSQWPAIQGIEESPVDGSSLFSVNPEFEVLEFGSEAAKKCADWLDREAYRGDHEILLRIYFDEEISSQEIRSQLPGPWGLQFLSLTEMPNRDYLDEYKKAVRGVRNGPDLWVGPPWEAPPTDVKFPFVVEPGLAFGTGDHPTTQLCLGRLYEHFQSGQRFTRILDLGTGSGILGAACRRFFPSAELTLTDLDPHCAEEVAKTFRLNHMSLAGVGLGFGAAGSAELLRRQGRRFDLIVSNIYAEVLAGLAPTIHELLEPGALWIVSGVLEGKPEDALTRATEKNFRCELRRTQLKTQSTLLPNVGLRQATETWVGLEFSAL